MAFHIPASCRPAFLVDITAGTLITLGMWFTGLANPVLRKTLAAPEQLVAVLIAIQTAVMILSPGWAGASHLRRKAPFITFGALATGLLLIVAGAVAPALQYWLPDGLLAQTFLGSSIDIWAFFLLMALVFAASSGFSALQVAVYRHNYPVAVRAKVVTRVNAVKVSVTLAVGVAVSLLMQWRPDLYAPLMVLGGLCLVAGGFVYRRMPVAGEDGLPASINAPELRRRLLPAGTVALLKADPHYRRFQLCQTLHGSGNLICEVAFPLIMLDPAQLNLDYRNYLTMNTIVPQVLWITSSFLWAPLVDRWSPSKVRVINTPFWILGMILFPLSVLVPGGLILAYLAFASRGLAQGGSSLLWSLGPLHYARTGEDASHYLAVHNYLTGVRGLIAVILGGVIYFLIGMWVFILGGAMMVLATYLFYRQDKAEQRDPNFRSESSLAASALAARERA
jgi:hypothetical protein